MTTRRRELRRIYEAFLPVNGLEADTDNAVFATLDIVGDAIYTRYPNWHKAYAVIADGLSDSDFGTFPRDCVATGQVQSLIECSAHNAIFDLANGNDAAWSYLCRCITDDPAKFQSLKRHLMTAWDAIRDFESEAEVNCNG